MSNRIILPYEPEGRSAEYIPIDNPYMVAARNYARAHSLDKQQPCAAVLVKNGEIIGAGANGSSYHNEHECERKRLGLRTGEDYELCEGCHPKNHSEPGAIADAYNRGNDPAGADLYLWGHWWCCKPCWDLMTAAGIGTVYLLEDSERFFNREHPDNIIGRQF